MKWDHTTPMLYFIKGENYVLRKVSLHIAEEIYLLKVNVKSLPNM